MSSFFDDEPNQVPVHRSLVESGARPHSQRNDVANALVNGPTPEATTEPEQTSVAPDIDWDDANSDADFIPKPPFRLGTLSIALVGLIIVGVGFLGGVLVQKHHDKGSSATAGRGGAGATFGGTRAAAGGAGAGGFGGQRGGAEGATGGFGGSGGFGTTGTGSGGQPGAGTAIPAVIGTVSSLTGRNMIVQNLGGKKVPVLLAASTVVTAKYGSILKVGASVAVSGSAAANGLISATSVAVQ
ncbi:DUF5666 domain-containing protein [Jatrophihabitans sp. DSM 45814]